MAQGIKDWNGKKVWLIGASFGIGRALAHSLANQGALLALSGRTLERLEDLRESVPGKHHCAFVLDVTNKTNLKNVFSKICEQWQQPNVIIYCAGAYHPGALIAGESKEFEQTLQTNFMGAVNLLQVVVPQIDKNHGCQIIFLGSVASYSGLPNSNVYGPSKAALLNFCEGMKIELEHLGIQIRVVSPGFVTTRLTEKNDFSMPLKISAEKAATSIIKGLRKNSFQIDFPKRLSLFLRFLRILPYPIYFWVFRRLIYKEIPVAKS